MPERDLAADRKRHHARRLRKLGNDLEQMLITLKNTPPGDFKAKLEREYARMIRLRERSYIAYRTGQRVRGYDPDEDPKITTALASSEWVMLTLSGLVTYIHRNGAKHEEQLYQYMFQEFDAIAHTEAERDQVILLLRTHYDMEYIKETSMYNHKLALPDLNIIPFRP